MVILLLCSMYGCDIFRCLWIGCILDDCCIIFMDIVAKTLSTSEL